MQKWYTVSECHKLTAYQESLLILCWKGSWKSFSKQQLISLVSCDTLAKLLTPIILDVKREKNSLGTTNICFRLCTEFLRLQSAKKFGCKQKKCWLILRIFSCFTSKTIEVRNLFFLLPIV